MPWRVICFKRFFFILLLSIHQCLVSLSHIYIGTLFELLNNDSCEILLNSPHNKSFILSSNFDVKYISSNSHRHLISTQTKHSLNQGTGVLGSVLRLFQKHNLKVKKKRRRKTWHQIQSAADEDRKKQQQ